VWDATTGAERPPIKGQVGGIVSVAFSADAKSLAAAGESGIVRLWDVATSAERQPVTDRPDWYTGARFRPDGGLLALMTRDYTIKLWDPARGGERAVLTGHKNDILSWDFSADGRLLATGSRDGTARIWDAVSGELHKTLSHEGHGVGFVGFTPDARTLVVGDGGGVGFWDSGSGQQRAALACPKGSQISCVALSPNGKTVVAGHGSDNLIQVCDVTTGKEQSPLQVSKETCRAIAFSLDGQLLVVREASWATKLWDWAANKERCSLPPSYANALSPDARTAATVSITADTGQLLVWDLATGQSKSLEGHVKRVESVAFSPDSQFLASAGQDGRVILWDPVTRRQKLHMWQLPGPVARVLFAPDNRHLVTINGNGTAYILRLP
jgi:WD40 repeat protein